MHHALQISEIVDLVIRDLAHPLPHIKGKTLAALAATCTMLHDVALDALWRHQDNILNLIRCMPDLWETVHVRGTPTLVSSEVSDLLGS
jgi:hypothetical protein